MAPTRKRENRENQFYNVGVQGRKTGIELPDTGIRDEFGMEPISNIFSSPAKSPPKAAADTVTESESMDIQESSIPELATSARIMRNSRTHLPPPRARSPMKTTLGSSPRRQSSMGPRATRADPSSSPVRAPRASGVNRVLDFQQEEEISVQETPALSGSGMRRGKRTDIYDNVSSPIRYSATLEEAIQEEMIATEVSAIVDVVADESFDANAGNDTTTGADAEDLDKLEESEAVPEETQVQPAKRGRKRKSAVLDSPAEQEQVVTKPKKRGVAAAQARDSETTKKGKRPAAAQEIQPRRSKRVSDLTEEGPSAALDTSENASEHVDPAPVAPKPRGRPPKAKLQPEPPAPVKSKQKAQHIVPVLEKENEEPVFKKPKTAAKPKKKADSKPSEKKPATNPLEGGRLIDQYGNPVSKEDIDKRSTTSAGSRFGGRSRCLSLFRELPSDSAPVGGTGRHRIAPVQFWSGETVQYDGEGNVRAIVKNVVEDPVPRKRSGPRSKGKKRVPATIEEEDDSVDVEPWEEDEGVFIGRFNHFDPENGQQQLVEDVVAWAPKGIEPQDVKDKSFKFVKLQSAPEGFLSWGFIELTPDQFKRSKSTGTQHLVFHVQTGVVMVKLLESEFVVRAGGVFSCPRGNFYSIRNVGTRTSRIFFAGGQKITPP